MSTETMATLVNNLMSNCCTHAQNWVLDVTTLSEVKSFLLGKYSNENSRVHEVTYSSIIIIKHIYKSVLTSKAIQRRCTIKPFMPKDIKNIIDVEKWSEKGVCHLHILIRRVLLNIPRKCALQWVSTSQEYVLCHAFSR